jgi:hypothetical protein
MDTGLCCAKCPANPIGFPSLTHRSTVRFAGKYGSDAYSVVFDHADGVVRGEPGSAAPLATEAEAESHQKQQCEGTKVESDRL